MWLGCMFGQVEEGLTWVEKQTSFRYLRKSKTSASLEVDIIGVNEGAKGPKWFANEEVRFHALKRKVK